MSAISDIAPGATQWATIGGHRLWYREAGTGHPLVHLHGAGGPAWDPAHALLAARYRVITPALPGFGESPLDLNMDNLPDLARLMAGFIREVAGDGAYVLGSSFGGRVATWVALLEPGAVDRLVLESPASFQRMGVPNAPATAVPDGPIPSMTRANPPEVELLDRIHEIQVPTLVLFGTDDDRVSPESGRLYKERMHDCSFALVYHAGHIIRRDRPESFANLVTDFLERGPAFLVRRD